MFSIHSRRTARSAALPWFLLPFVCGCGGGGVGGGGGEKPGQPAAPRAVDSMLGKNSDGAAPAGTYGETGNEEVAPADPSLPNTLLRSRAGDTFYLIRNPRFGQDQFGRKTLEIDYEVKKVGPHNGVSVQLHGEDGSQQTILILGPMQSHGTLSLELPFPVPGRAPLSSNAEIFFTRGDPRYGPQSPTFKVSNSTVMGTVTHLTRARNWTADEIARLTQPPPNYSSPDLHPGVGTDTEIAGDSVGGIPRRYVEPGGHLLGVEYRVSEWEGEKCLGGLTPIFSANQPVIIPERIVARPGYAVGAVEVRTGKLVDAIRLVFFRIRDDGGLDVSDSYESQWLGAGGDGPTRRLTGDGKAVIGIKCQQGAVLNGLALVLAS